MALNILFRKSVDEILDFLPRCLFFDIIWAYWRYFIEIRRVLNLKNPKTFTEKLQWLKLFDRNPINRSLVDKYEVRSYVKNKLGDAFLIPLLGVYDSVEEIDFSRLPKAFVLKCVHGSGWNIICRDKTKLDIALSKQKLSKWMGENFYYRTREWVYKDIKPRIICEKFISEGSSQGLIDYKFFCFHGEPKYVRVDVDRFANHGAAFYNLNWELQPFSANLYSYSGIADNLTRPKNLNEMVEAAKKLSEGLKFVRVDLYSAQGKIFFGEMTFFPGNGFIKFNPYTYDRKIGDLLIIK